MEGAVVHRGFAEIADRDLLRFPILGSEGEPGCERDVPSHDAVAAHEAAPGVEQVHRPALALGGTRGLAEQLGHDRARRHAASQRVPVLAVGADDVVVRSQRGDTAYRDRLLPDVEMAETADLAEAVGFAGLLLEPADEHHLSEPAARLLGDGGGAGFGAGTRPAGGGGAGHQRLALRA